MLMTVNIKETTGNIEGFFSEQVIEKTVKLNMIPSQASLIARIRKSKLFALA
jgi:hypothetical protein